MKKRDILPDYFLTLHHFSLREFLTLLKCPCVRDNLRYKTMENQQGKNSEETFGLQKLVKWSNFKSKISAIVYLLMSNRKC